MKQELQEVFEFGNNWQYKVERAAIQHNQLRRESVTIDRLPPIDANPFYQALEEINDSWQVLTDEQTGKTFEIATANPQADLTNGVDIELSTFSSSISGNLGNAVEFAEHSVLHSDRQRLYVASFGNGKTSYWDSDEQIYIKQTGKFIDGDGTPLPTIAALERVLRLGDYAVTRASTNSAGGAYATALMHALPEGQMTHAYIKSRPNISNHPLQVAWAAEMLAFDGLDDSKHQKASRDPWRLTDILMEEAKALMPRIYSPDKQVNQAQAIPEDTRTHGLKKIWDDMIALSRGKPDAMTVSPAVADTTLALKQQPEAHLTYHFPSHDRLYNSPADIYDFLQQVHSHTFNDLMKSDQVEALLMPGTHRDHSAYPALRWSVESYAFDR